MPGQLKRIGLFVCHCGANIAGTVDIDAVVHELGGHVSITYAADYRYLCSEPGQKLIGDAIKEQELEGIVVAACSPTLHQNTFRRVAALAGLNPYQCEIANIREQCSWVHRDREEATRKAVAIIKSAIAKLRLDEPLHPIGIPISAKALVVGGGMAGTRAALSIAAGGYDVILVERDSVLGGHAARLGHTFPELAPAKDMVKAEVEAATCDPHIKVMTSSELEELSGYVGNFDVAIRTNGDTVSWERVGAVVVASGFDLFEVKDQDRYGGGRHPDVVDAFEFEALVSDPSGELRRPSDGRVPETVLLVQCVGFHDGEEKGPLAYCSKVCCMYVVKQSLLYRKRVPQGQVYVSCRNVCAAGKGFEELTRKVQAEEQAVYTRGPVRRITGEGGRLRVLCHDEVMGKEIEIAADLVVLVPGMVPRADTQALARTLRVATDSDGFFKEAHPKLRPLETQSPGIFLAGCCQGPKDIAETIAQALGAAAHVKALFAEDQLFHEPTVTDTHDGKCARCCLCVQVCPRDARSLVKNGRAVEVNEVLCDGCGICAAVCPGKAIDHRNYTDEQVFGMLRAMLGQPATGDGRSVT